MDSYYGDWWGQETCPIAEILTRISVRDFNCITLPEYLLFPSFMSPWISSSCFHLSSSCFSSSVPLYSSRAAVNNCLNVHQINRSGILSLRIVREVQLAGERRQGVLWVGFVVENDVE